MLSIVSEPKDKKEQALHLCQEAQALADIKGANQLQMGIIALKVKEDPELIKLSGEKSYESWIKNNFGKKRTTAYRWRLVVEKLLGKFATAEELLGFGSVKAFELSRLPESQLTTQKWQEMAKAQSTSEFKHSVAAFLENRPDHMEERFWLHVSMPESFRPVLDLSIAMAEALAAQDGETLQGKPDTIEYIFAGFVKALQGEVDLEQLKVKSTEED
jgi:hypothetical protein